MTNVMDIIIVDLQGIEYDINDIRVEGNDVMTADMPLSIVLIGGFPIMNPYAKRVIR